MFLTSRSGSETSYGQRFAEVDKVPLDVISTDNEPKHIEVVQSMRTCTMVSPQKDKQLLDEYKAYCKGKRHSICEGEKGGGGGGPPSLLFFFIFFIKFVRFFLFLSFYLFVAWKVISDVAPPVTLDDYAENRVCFTGKIYDSLLV